MIFKKSEFLKSQTFSINREASCKRERLEKQVRQGWENRLEKVGKTGWKRMEKIERKARSYILVNPQKYHIHKSHNSPQNFHSWVLKSKPLNLSYLASSAQPSKHFIPYRGCLVTFQQKGKSSS